MSQTTVKSTKTEGEQPVAADAVTQDGRFSIKPLLKLMAERKASDLFFTSNALSPSWTFIGTVVPAAAGAQTLSATYTLPAGALQAVRAQFRYQSTAAACAMASMISTPGITETCGKCPGKKGSLMVTFFTPTQESSPLMSRILSSIRKG